MSLLFNEPATDDSGGDNFGFPTMVFLVKWVTGWGPEQRESGKTVLNLLIISIILIRYISIYYYEIIN